MPHSDDDERMKALYEQLLIDAFLQKMRKKGFTKVIMRNEETGEEETLKIPKP